MYFSEISSPVGGLRLVSDGEALCRIDFMEKESAGGSRSAAAREEDDGVLKEARTQLEAWFAGRLRLFDLPLAPAGTAFQQQVWKALREIPYGATTCYAEIAERIGRPGGGA